MERNKMEVVGCIRGTTLHGSLGGMELAAKKLYEGLAAKGCNVTVLTSAIETDQLNEITVCESGVKYIFLPTSSKQEYSGQYHNLINDFFSRELLYKTDIVHSSSAGASSLCHFIDKVPIVATWHGLSLEQELDKVFKYQYIDEKTIHASNVVDLITQTVLPKLKGSKVHYNSYSHHVGISEYMSSLLSLYDIPKKKITTIPNSISGEFFSKNTASSTNDIDFNKEKKCVLGVVGRAIPEKGHKVVVNALSRLSDDYEVLLIGAGPESSLYDRVQQKVTKIRLHHDQMPQAYKLIDVFLNPTLRISGFDLTVLESLASHVPVIVSDLPQYAGFLKQYEFNKLDCRMICFSLGSDKHLAEVIERVKLKNASLPDAKLSQMGILADNDMIDAYLNLFKKLCEQKRCKV
ncbi:MAG: hypothetical protein Alis3KO_25740 [Aliiglaciecola sp.]